MANIQIKLHNAGATIDRLRAKAEEALPQVSEVILQDCNVYVRMQSGTLAQSARLEDGGHRITWNTKYAKRVYYTGTPRTNRNASASLMWCERAKAANEGKWQELLQRLING